jgi:hypothetical protein
VCLIAPFPFNKQPPELFDPIQDFDMTGAGKIWYARPQLFFSCMVCPRGQKATVAAHIKLSLVFFNTFDPIDLSPQSVMADKGIPMLCEDAPNQMPTMYICPVTNVLGRIPLIPCYMDGQTHATIPHRFRRSNLGGAIADSMADNGTGSRLYELNVWMWRYGRSLPRTISVAESENIRQKRLLESRSKSAETKRRRRDARHEEQT